MNASNASLLQTSEHPNSQISDDSPAPLHLHRRIFIGPLPEKFVSQTEAYARKRSDNDIFLGRTSPQDGATNGSSNISQIVKDHAFQFFVREGGRQEDWNVDQERSIAEELLQRWYESEWGAIWHGRTRKQRQGETRDVPQSRWVGGSFEVGHLFDVNVLGEFPSEDTSAPEEPVFDISAGPPGSQNGNGNGNRNGDGKHDDTHPNTNDLFMDTSSKSQYVPSSPGSTMNVVASPATSHTGLLERSSHLKSTSTLDFGRTQIPEASFSRKSKGKSKKRVHYNEDNRDSLIPRPASPAEVLSRTSQTVEVNTSAAANVPFVPCPPAQDPADGDVILRDRMLVKISSTKAHNLSPVFHESIHRTTRDLEYEDWGEFMVAWRKDLIEIYEDYNTPLQEWAAGHKRLAYVIPLKSNRTHLSLYSFIDMTFCITCQPMCTSFTKQTKWNFTKLDGTCVYIFNNKSRSRAYDWVWQLWRYMGGEIPRSVNIHNPHLGSQVAVELPSLNLMDQKTAIRMFSRRNIIALCIKSMKSIPGWSNFIDHERKKGRMLQLAWRSETHVDWVWNDQSCEDKQREWTVLSGLALKNSPRAPVLELRVAEHFPTSLYLKDGTLLVQPPDIEGYVNRIRPNTQSKQLLYLAAHDGHLFTISPQQAQPPSPPGCALLLDTIEEYKQRIMKVELERGIYQIMHAHAVFDLRNVVAVRRAFQIIPQHRHEQMDGKNRFDVWARANERSNSDDEDEGGEESLSRASHKPHLRMKRSFELLLNNGRVLRFEVHSRRVAIEWVERLHALAEYWNHRNRANAKEEIDLGQATHPRVTPQIRVCDEDEAPSENPDPSAHYPALDRLFNWCVIDGCRSITKAGRLYMRKGLRGQFKLVQMYLVDGHLVPFHIAPGYALHVAMRKRINLVDAYVCSGYMAALTLPKGQYCPNAPIAARRYEDGLEANDREEDMLIVIRYRKHAPEIPQRPGIVLVPNSKANNTPGSQWIPPLSEKHRHLILRTRSKIERDAWCWALNIEIEKLTRKQKEREEKLRQTGDLRRLD